MAFFKFSLTKLHNIDVTKVGKMWAKLLYLPCLSDEFTLVVHVQKQAVLVDARLALVNTTVKIVLIHTPKLNDATFCTCYCLIACNLLKRASG